MFPLILSVLYAASHFPGQEANTHLLYSLMCGHANPLIIFVPSLDVKLPNNPLVEIRRISHIVCRACMMSVFLEDRQHIFYAGQSKKDSDISTNILMTQILFKLTPLKILQKLYRLLAFDFSKMYWQINYYSLHIIVLIICLVNGC